MFDTNVKISALKSAIGASFQHIRSVRAGELRAAGDRSADIHQLTRQQRARREALRDQYRALLERAKRTRQESRC